MTETATQQNLQIKLKTGAIYKHCQELGISRDELSRRMGVATTTTYRVEKGDVEPSPKFIAALMHTTGHRFEELFVIAQAAA